MPRSSEPRPGRSAGFTLIEVVVALGIISVVVTALLPQLVIGIRATRTAQLAVQAKALVQGELEEMRNLPYRVAPDAGPYIDVLDRFFPDTEPPEIAPAHAPDCRAGDGYVMPTTAEVAGWEGYVLDPTVPGVACSYEPGSGPFYRTVQERTHPDLGRVVLVTDTQYLRITQGTPDPAPVAPRPNYDSGRTGFDSPPTSQVGVTLTVLYPEGRRIRGATTYTQIAQRISSPARLDARVEATAVEVASTDEAGASISMRAGVLTLAGALTHASTASADLTAVAARRASTATTTGVSGDGAARTLVAPPTQSVVAPTEGAGCVDPLVAMLCWGASSLAPATLTLTTAEALPQVGQPPFPVGTLLHGSENSGVRFDNTAPRPDGTRYRGTVRAPLVSFESPTASSGGCTSPASGFASAAGFVHTTEATLETCGQVHAGVISLLPTAEHPTGLVKIRLGHAWTQCRQGSALPATGFGYEATVTVSGSAQGPWTITKGGPNTLPPPASVVIGTGTLADYIASWDPLTDAEVTVGTDGGASVSVPGVLTLLTTGVRPVDDATAAPAPSDVRMTVGTVSCSARDER